MAKYGVLKTRFLIRFAMDFSSAQSAAQSGRGRYRIFPYNHAREKNRLEALPRQRISLEDAKLLHYLMYLTILK